MNMVGVNLSILLLGEDRGVIANVNPLNLLLGM